MINSKKKGKKGELELARKLREFGYDCRRGQQYSGIGGDDVVGLPHIHIECKRQEGMIDLKNERDRLLEKKKSKCNWKGLQ